MLNICDEELYKKVLELDSKLDNRASFITNYQLLGVNMDCNKDELIKNYKMINGLIEKHSNCFSKEEINNIKEAYKTFTSFLGAAWYEHEIGSSGAKNVNLLYENNKKMQNYFELLRQNIGTEVLIKFLNNKDGEIFPVSSVGEISSVVDYDSVGINHADRNTKKVYRSKIDFLSKDMAIVNIHDGNDKILYSNPYLEELCVKYNHGDCSVFSSYIDNADAYRVLCYGFFMAKIHDVNENADVIEIQENKKYTKKI